MWKIKLNREITYPKQLIMQYILVFLVCISSLVFSADLPHFILHFDVNKTLIATDEGTHKTIEDVLNELLAEKYISRWDETLEEEISFDSYVRQVLVPGSHDDLLLRALRRKYLDHFLDYLHEHAHPLYEQVFMDYETALAVLKMSQGKVFPSFYRLIDELERRQISYSIILRSFGQEVFAVQKEIENFCKTAFAHQGRFQRGAFHLHTGEIIENSSTIYELFRDAGHIAIQDDWKHWAMHGLIGKYGKPFPLNLQDSTTISLFFDDHIRPDDPAVKVNIIAPLEASTGELIPIHLINHKNAIRVDTLKAILDADYYLNIIQKTILNLQ